MRSAHRRHASTRGTPYTSFLASSAFWIKADSLALGDAVPVSSWPDQSGHGRDCLQATGTKQPLFKSGLYNGKPAVRFDGATQFMQTASLFSTLNNNVTLIVVAREIGAVNARTIWTNGNTNSNGYGLAARTPTPKVGYLRGGLAWHDTTTAPDTVSPHVFVLQANAATWKVWVDGGPATGSFTNTPFAPSGTGVSLASHDGGTTCWNGDIAEAGFWESVLAMADLNTVAAGLAAKYGLTWTTAT